MAPKKHADLVLEGAGAKWIALVGAYSVIEERGYSIQRVAGISAGSLVGALLAAGMSAADLEKEMQQLDYRKFRDRGSPGNLRRPLSVTFERGAYEGKHARHYVRDRLARHGINTFADLRYVDPDHRIQGDDRYRLLVMVSDISRGRLRRLPWDYPLYGLSADEQAVADAVRASMSIPFFFEPVTLSDETSGKDSVLIDGGVLSKFPIGVFDAPNEREPRWPTFGIKLSVQARTLGMVFDRVSSVNVAMVRAMTNFYDRLYIDDPATQARTIFVDTGRILTTDFDLTSNDLDFLLASGRKAAEKFFDGCDGQPAWDWEAYKSRFR